MAPPGPIPNPEVKHQHVDGSRTTGPARVDSCQGKRSPQSERIAGFIVCVRSTQISSMHSMDIVRHQPDIVQPQAGYRSQYSRAQNTEHFIGKQEAHAEENSSITRCAGDRDKFCFAERISRWRGSNFAAMLRENFLPLARREMGRQEECNRMKTRPMARVKAQTCVCA